MTTLKLTRKSKVESVNLTLRSRDRELNARNKPPPVTGVELLQKQAQRILLSDFFERDENIEFVLLLTEILLEQTQDKVEISFPLQKSFSKIVNLCNQVARVICNTYLETGEEAELADDEALELIRDFLLDFDEEIIMKNIGKQVIRRSKKRARNPKSKNSLRTKR